MPTRKELLDAIGDFSWDFHRGFFVETEFGNFVWADPDYDGDNTFTKFDGDYVKYCFGRGGPNFFCRDKGKHFIRNYCGDEIKVIGFELESTPDSAPRS